MQKRQGGVLLQLCVGVRQHGVGRVVLADVEGGPLHVQGAHGGEELARTQQQQE
jgi:hypothetical protein